MLVRRDCSRFGRAAHPLRILKSTHPNSTTRLCAGHRNFQLIGAADKQQFSLFHRQLSKFLRRVRTSRLYRPVALKSGVDMFKIKVSIVLLALVGAASFPVSSYAADAADVMTDLGVGMVEDAMMAPPAPGFGGPVVLVRGVTYQDWLQRQHPPGAILYNMPCTVSDGVHQRGVPCEAVAAALSGEFIPGVYPVEQPVLAYAGDAPCYYDDGWNGPGYYLRGSAWNCGYGWSGRHLSGGRRSAGSVT